MTPAQKIKDARTRLNLTQAQFAKALGLRRSKTVSDYERGAKEPTQTILTLVQLLLEKAGK